MPINIRIKNWSCHNDVASLFRNNIIDIVPWFTYYKLHGLSDRVKRLYPYELEMSICNTATTYTQLLTKLQTLHKSNSNLYARPIEHSIN